jgi:NAD(P)H-binding
VAVGELTDRDAVRRAVHGAEAVISALGPSPDRKATGMPLIEGTRTVVDATRTEGVERYIGMATPSLRDPRDGSSVLGRLVPSMGRTFLSRAYRELLEMSQIVIDIHTSSDFGRTSLSDVALADHASIRGSGARSAGRRRGPSGGGARGGCAARRTFVPPPSARGRVPSRGRCSAAITGVTPRRQLATVLVVVIARSAITERARRPRSRAPGATDVRRRPRPAVRIAKATNEKADDPRHLP